VQNDKRLIDANALEDRAYEIYVHASPEFKTRMNTLKELIDSAPTVDAVPVVRCKDCVNRGTSYSCPMRKLVMPVEGPGAYEDCTEDMGFCHMGKRREGSA
jgi:hypothetical protein